MTEHRYDCPREEFEDAAYPEPTLWDSWPRIVAGAVIILAVTLIGVAVMAQEQQRCEPREFIVAQLEGRYGEAQQGAGLTQSGTVLEIWASHETGTWTVLVTRPDGTTCPVAAGGAWTSGDKPGRAM